MKKVTKKEIKSKSTLNFIMSSMPNITDEALFDMFDVSTKMTTAFLAKKAVTFLN